MTRFASVTHARNAGRFIPSTPFDIAATANQRAHRRRPPPSPHPLPLSGEEGVRATMPDPSRTGRRPQHIVVKNGFFHLHEMCSLARRDRTPARPYAYFDANAMRLPLLPSTPWIHPHLLSLPVLSHLMLGPPPDPQLP
uniref:Uncharacterized protein n=1 Tax=Hordeum vulgare subsp. vulgare TaxID=112509 RepID=A0A8I6WP86_HORVV